MIKLFGKISRKSLYSIDLNWHENEKIKQNLYLEKSDNYLERFLKIFCKVTQAEFGKETGGKFHCF